MGLNSSLQASLGVCHIIYSWEDDQNRYLHMLPNWDGFASHSTRLKSSYSSKQKQKQKTFLLLKKKIFQ